MVSIFTHIFVLIVASELDYEHHININLRVVCEMISSYQIPLRCFVTRKSEMLHTKEDFQFFKPQMIERNRIPSLI